MLDVAPLFPETVRPLRRREYERLVELGVFDDERIELLRGVLVTMSPQGAPHADAISRLGAALTTALAGRAVVRQHSPIALTEDSEPEPDIAVVPEGSYAHEHPATALLVVEVADSSLRKDRELKAPLYASAGVPEYWLVDLVHHTVEVGRTPGPDGYGEVRVRAWDEAVALSAFPDVAVVFRDLLA